MTDNQIKTHTDGIWISTPREIAVIQQITDAVQQQGFNVMQQDSNNYGYPYIFTRDHQNLHCRFVDSVFLSNVITEQSTVITDNIPLQPMSGTFELAVPEFWSIWHFDPEYQDRTPSWGYNCFMNRARGDRSIVFYELIRRNILHNGLVSFNLTESEYQNHFMQDKLHRYQIEHSLGQVPYNNLTGTLEQCIMDSRVSLILETYISNTHIVFSEKIFRCLQLPRPWLLYCSPQSIEYLRNYGFDVLDDYVDHTYDNIITHYHRLNTILNQLETFVDRRYCDQDYARFTQAASHNQLLLKSFEQKWPDKLNQILEKITKI
jgi:hypothetical protein